MRHFYLKLVRVRKLLSSIIFFGLLLAGASSRAQSWGFVGVKGGGHFSNVFFNDTFRPVNMNTSIVYGRHFGVVGKYFMSEHAGVQVEALYAEKGYEQLLLFTVDDSARSGYYATTMNYIEIPFLMNAYLGKRKLQFFINLGPYVEIFLDQKEVRLGDLPDGGEWYPFDPEKDRTFGYGLRASGGINRLFPFGQFQLEGGFGMSLSDMIVSNRLVSDVPDGSKHYLGFVSVAYMLPVGRAAERK